MRLHTALFLTFAALPAPAFACGGLFCNNTTPVVQAEESILFAVDGDTTHMHVRIVYSGPPQEFGWLLPVPRGVETSLSGEGILAALDNFRALYFIDHWEQEVLCREPEYIGGEGEGAGGAGGGGGEDDGGPGVDVVSREAIGPYDRAILDARTVEDLRRWLGENGYQVPGGADEKLRPYVDQGAVFVAIKLLPGEDVGDIVPLHLSFPGTVPTIPIVPTGVAASPDMSVAVHVLGQARAVPLNYLHVQVNEAAIDWLGYPGDNYFSVVAQAADEAGGQAFATDFAARLTRQNTPIFYTATQDLLDRLAEVHTVADLSPLTCELPLSDPDIARLLRGILRPADFGGEEYPLYLDCAGAVENSEDDVVDGAALAARIRTEVNEPRLAVAGLFERQPYLTRLTSSLSADEMTEDPAFAFNPDLPEVSSIRKATGIVYQCAPDGGYDDANVRVRTPSGLLLEYHAGANDQDAILRERGATMRQGAEPGAAVIERLLESGAPLVEEDRSAEIAARHPGSRGGPTGDSGCGCRTTDGGAEMAGLGLLAVFALRRRRNRNDAGASA